MEDYIGLIITIGLPVLFLGGSWLIHYLIERSRRHYLDVQEEHFRNCIRLTNLKRFPAGQCRSPMLVTGSAVVANNYFVSNIARFKHIFGGELKGYTQLCDDARRMALIRMLQEAEQAGANMVYNLRFETATITSGNSKQAGGVEMIAYGTAVTVDAASV